MSEQNKLDFIRKYELSLVEEFTPEQIQRIVIFLRAALNDYDLSLKVTDMVPYDTTNQDILMQFASCLLISGKSKKSIKQYIRTMQRLLEYKNQHLDVFTATDIKAYLASEMIRGVSNRTISNTRNYISAFFKWASEENIIPTNPCLSVKAVKYRREIEPAFTDVQIDKMRNYISSKRDRAIFELLLSSGIRVNELCNLKTSDIDTKALKVFVHNGKGGKDRITYMSRVAAHHIELYLNGRTDGPLFKSYDNRDEKYQDKLSTDGVRTILSNIGSAVSIDKCHPHRFRHTFATSLYNKGMDIHEIQLLMGHSNVSTTINYISTDDNKIGNSYVKFLN